MPKFWFAKIWVGRSRSTAGCEQAQLGLNLVLLILSCLGSYGAAGEWPSLEFLRTAPPNELQRVLIPFMNMTTLSYTQTFGSYFEPEHQNQTTPGWSREYSLERNPRNGGMHALVFVNHTLQLGVISFRGTDLNVSVENPSGLADHCADLILWDSLTYRELPDECRLIFPKSTLDYLSSGLELVEMMKAKYPEMGILTTGHSLGAGLATLVSGLRKLKSISFADPGTATVLKRLHVSSAVDVDGNFVFANEWDPVYHNSSEEQVGTICLWPDREPPSCKRCYSEKKETVAFRGALLSQLVARPEDQQPLGHHPDQNVTDCDECFARIHIWSHYISYISGHQFRRPNCSSNPWPRDLLP